LVLEGNATVKLDFKVATREKILTAKAELKWKMVAFALGCSEPDQAKPG